MSRQIDRRTFLGTTAKAAAAGALMGNIEAFAQLIADIFHAPGPFMPGERAEITTQKLTNLWRSFGNRQSTLEQWL